MEAEAREFNECRTNNELMNDRYVAVRERVNWRGDREGEIKKRRERKGKRRETSNFGQQISFWTLRLYPISTHKHRRRSREIKFRKMKAENRDRDREIRKIPTINRRRFQSLLAENSAAQMREQAIETLRVWLDKWWRIGRRAESICPDTRRPAGSNQLSSVTRLLLLFSVLSHSDMLSHSHFARTLHVMSCMCERVGEY